MDFFTQTLGKTSDEKLDFGGFSDKIEMNIEIYYNYDRTTRATTSQDEDKR